MNANLGEGGMGTVPRKLDWDAAKRRLSELQATLDRSLIPSDAEMERVYRKRAEFLAQIPQRGEGENADKILVFRAGSSRFGIALEAVSEVITRPGISAVPGAPADVAGLIQVRGEVRPIWNLRGVLGLPAEHNAAKGGGQVVLLRNGQREIGILVEHLEDIVSSTVQRQPAPGGSLHGSWITPDFVTVLDVPALIEKLQNSGSL